MLQLIRPRALQLPRELVRIALRSHFSTSTRFNSSQFSFVVGQAFHTKPTDSQPRKGQDGKLIQSIVQGFPPDSPIARWRDESLKVAPWGAGHDWLFQEDTDGGGVVVGLADGVGGWEESGIDPSHFAQGLMYYAREEVCKHRGDLKGPREILREAYNGVLKEDGVVAGSSTACILSFDGRKGSLQAANLGDSTFFILRAGSVIHNQPSQCHFFNAPLQLAKMPPGKRQKGSLIDQPEDAALFQTQLQPGDLVVVATDGFSDNVHVGELEQITKLVLEHQVRDSASDGETMDRLALACVNFARLCSFKEDKVSPFELEARRQGINFPGGKVDDTTVITILVST
ncbi:hypothetical protein RQP46_004999 [Phenoliferia psychrophenolica]